MPASSPVRLLLVGGGHASISLLKAAGRWTRRGLSVTLLSDHPTLYYSGMVPEYLGGVYAPADVQIDLPWWCKQTGARWVQGTAAALDAAARTVTTAAGARHAYDVAVFDVGSYTPGHAQAPGAIPTKPLHRIEQLATFVRETLHTPHPRRLVIVGGGAAGTEVALNISGRFAGTGRHGALQLTLLEPAARLLPAFPEGMGRYAAHLLEQRGVFLRYATRAVTAASGRVVLERGRALSCDAVLWATGTEGPPLFRQAGLACDAKGFVRVSRTLQVPGHPRLFAAGDCAVIEEHEDLARVGVHAVKQGPLLRGNVDRVVGALLEGRPPEAADVAPFRPYPVAPLILSTGAAEGLFVAGPCWLRSPLALRLKHWLDLRWMSQYKRPATVPTSLRARLHDRAAADTTR